MLTVHDWPGNIRELRNVLERGIVLGEARSIEMPTAVHGGAEAPPPEFDGAKSYRENKERWENDFEQRYLKWLMQRSEGNISRAAREADMDRKYLHKLLKKHQLVH